MDGPQIARGDTHRARPIDRMPVDRPRAAGTTRVTDRSGKEPVGDEGHAGRSPRGGLQSDPGQQTAERLEAGRVGDGEPGQCQEAGDEQQQVAVAIGPGDVASGPRSKGRPALGTTIGPDHGHPLVGGDEHIDRSGDTARRSQLDDDDPAVDFGHDPDVEPWLPGQIAKPLQPVRPLSKDEIPRMHPSHDSTDNGSGLGPPDPVWLARPTRTGNRFPTAKTPAERQYRALGPGAS